MSTYRYGRRGAETLFYPGSSITCVVKFDYNRSDQTYKLSLEQWTHIQQELQRLQRSR